MTFCYIEGEGTPFGKIPNYISVIFLKAFLSHNIKICPWSRAFTQATKLATNWDNLTIFQHRQPEN
jgi:hypothetical protein